MKKYVTDVYKGIYLKEYNIEVQKNYDVNNKIEVNSNKIITSFLGFGSAITESSAYNYDKLSKTNKQKFIKDYYSKSGLNYNLGRISIGSNDFSLSAYSYSKKRNLNDFSIRRDHEYIIPFLSDILNTKKISLIASPWSPPRMYKRIPLLSYGFKLAKKHYDNYCDYLIKYLDEYQKIGINIDYLTVQNEPVARQRWESCKFSIKEQKDFIYNHFVAKLNNTKLLLWDHNKDNLFNIINELYEKNNKIAGIGFHYYTGNCFDEIKKIREKYPELLLINTEMCTGYSQFDEKKWLIDAEYYLNDIIGDMNCGVNAYLDWNVLLDENGGPTYKKNYVKSASLRINSDYKKSPIYYYIYHISHFLGKTNYIIDTKSFTNKLKIVSLKCDNKIIVVIMNNSETNIKYNLEIQDKNICDTIKTHTIITYIM